MTPRDQDAPPTEVVEQIDRVYRLMDRTIRYRPAAPSDGFGNIACPLEELDLDAEIREYANEWWQQEDACQFLVGCANSEEREPMVLLIEAAKQCCTGFLGRDLALALAKAAVRELEAGAER
jgi:hypothetical protein